MTPTPFKELPQALPRKAHFRFFSKRPSPTKNHPFVFFFSQLSRQLADTYYWIVMNFLTRLPSVASLATPSAMPAVTADDTAMTSPSPFILNVRSYLANLSLIDQDASLSAIVPILRHPELIHNRFAETHSLSQTALRFHQMATEHLSDADMPARTSLRLYFRECFSSQNLKPHEKGPRYFKMLVKAVEQVILRSADSMLKPTDHARQNRSSDVVPRGTRHANDLAQTRRVDCLAMCN